MHFKIYFDIYAIIITHYTSVEWVCIRTFFCDPFLDKVGLCVENPGFCIPKGFGFFNELLKGDAVLPTLVDVATDAIEPFPAAPLYGFPLASVIDILPPEKERTEIEKINNIQCQY